MNRLLEQILNGKNGEYDSLPESIKAAYSPREYSFLSDLEKARLIETETEPEFV